MRPLSRSRRRGFSLLEVVITMTLMLILVAGMGQFMLNVMRDMKHMRLQAFVSEVASVHDIMYLSNGKGIGGATVDDLLNRRMPQVVDDGHDITWSDPNFEFVVHRDLTLPRAAYDFHAVNSTTYSLCYIPPDNPQVPMSRLVRFGACSTLGDALTPTGGEMAVPELVTATAEGTSITVSWNPVDPGWGNVLYTVYRCDSTNGPCEPTVQAGTTTRTTFIDVNRPVGSNFTYAVTAAAGNVSTLSDTASAAMTPGTPVIQTSGWDSAAQGVRLTWAAPLTGGAHVQSYTVLRCTDPCIPSTGNSIGTVAKDATLAYVDTDITYGAVYQYAVVAVNGTGSSNPVNATVQQATPPAAATVSATVDTGSVSLSWSGATAATSYTVYECTSSACTSRTPVASDLTATSTELFVDAGTHWFQVVAANSVDAGPVSNTVTATVPA